MTNALKIVNGIIVELTDEEKAAIETAVEEYGKQELKRPLEPNEVFQLLSKQIVNTVDIDDQTSLRMKSYYPTFEEIVGVEVDGGFKFTYQGDLWKVREGKKHTPQKQYPPSINTASLYERIDETHLGTIDDPIPYDQTMAVYKDKYYSYNDKLYLCIRDSGIPLYAEPDALLNNYFKLVEQESGDGDEEEIDVPDGSKEKPFPYDQTQPVTNGMYYIHEGVVYLCIRDSGIGLNAAPASLLNNYFKLAE